MITEPKINNKKNKLPIYYTKNKKFVYPPLSSE